MSGVVLFVYPKDKAIWYFCLNVFGLKDSVGRRLERLNYAPLQDVELRELKSYNLLDGPRYTTRPQVLWLENIYQNFIYIQIAKEKKYEELVSGILQITMLLQCHLEG